MERKVLEFGEVDLLGIGEVFIEGADRALKIAVPPPAPFGAGGWLRLITGRTWNSASLSVSMQAGANERRLARARGRIEDNDTLGDQEIAELK